LFAQIVARLFMGTDTLIIAQIVFGHVAWI